MKGRLVVPCVVYIFREKQKHHEMLITLFAESLLQTRFFYNISTTHAQNKLLPTIFHYLLWLLEDAHHGKGVYSKEAY